MKLILRPPGRGNWATVVLTVEGRRAPPPMFFAVGQKLVLGGQTFKVARVQP